jgi:hypothetical protein
VFELIKELTELAGPVGQEQVVLDYIEPLWREAGAAAASSTRRRAVLSGPVDRPGWLPLARERARLGAQD